MLVPNNIGIIINAKPFLYDSVLEVWWRTKIAHLFLATSYIPTIAIPASRYWLCYWELVILSLQSLPSWGR
jgi:hypothetical protein